MSDDYLHWHGLDDKNTEPPGCCVNAIETAWRRRVEAAEHAERRRIILNALQAIRAYGDAATSVLQPADAALVTTVTDKAIEAIRAGGCICPRIDTSNFADHGAWMPGYDPECGMHEVLP